MAAYGLQPSASTASASDDVLNTQEWAAGSADAQQVPLSKYRFHCEKDTLEINNMLGSLASVGQRPINEIVVEAAKLLEGRPYVGHTLEGEIEQMVINIDQLDCVTFVESCFALAKAASVGSRSWRDYARYLEDLRYRGGKQYGYDSRLHYTTDWFTDNIYRGNIKEVTTSIPGYRTVNKTLNFMTRNRDLYPALADEQTFEACKEVERGFYSMQIPYITREDSRKASVAEHLRDGDMISFLSKKDGLDSSHVALLRIIDGKPYMMHASLKKGKVTFETEPLYDYFKYSKRDSPGFRVVRLL